MRTYTYFLYLQSTYSTSGNNILSPKCLLAVPLKLKHRYLLFPALKMHFITFFSELLYIYILQLDLFIFNALSDEMAINFNVFYFFIIDSSMLSFVSIGVSSWIPKFFIDLTIVQTFWNITLYWIMDSIHNWHFFCLPLRIFRITLGWFLA